MAHIFPYRNGFLVFTFINPSDDGQRLTFQCCQRNYCQRPMQRYAGGRSQDCMLRMCYLKLHQALKLYAKAIRGSFYIKQWFSYILYLWLSPYCAYPEFFCSNCDERDKQLLQVWLKNMKLSKFLSCTAGNKSFYFSTTQRDGFNRVSPDSVAPKTKCNVVHVTILDP